MMRRIWQPIKEDEPISWEEKWKKYNFISKSGKQYRWNWICRVVFGDTVMVTVAYLAAHET